MNDNEVVESKVLSQMISEITRLPMSAISVSITDRMYSVTINTMEERSATFMGKITDQIVEVIGVSAKDYFVEWYNKGSRMFARQGVPGSEGTDYVNFS